MKQVHPVWLCLLWSKWFEGTFVNAQWRKVKKCNQCDYASSHAGTLRRHFKTHSTEKSNKCNQCNYATSDRRGEKLNKCNQCEYVSSRAGNLRTHLKTHRGEKAKKCNQFDFASSQAGDLRRHLKKHSGEKSNKCNQCGFASFYSSALRTHLKTHSGENSNICNQCDHAACYANTQRRKVKQMQPMWLRLFLGRRFEATFDNAQWRKSNTCNQCDFASSQTGQRTHLKSTVEKSKTNATNVKILALIQVHWRRRRQFYGEMSYKCNQWDFASSEAGNSRRHLKIHSGEKPMRCRQWNYNNPLAQSFIHSWGWIQLHIFDQTISDHTKQ